MTVQIKVIENYDFEMFEDNVNLFLKEWSYRIVSYGLGKNLVGVKKRLWGNTNIYMHEALFVVDDELPKDSPRKIIPRLNMGNEAKRSDTPGSGVL